MVFRWARRQFRRAYARKGGSVAANPTDAFSRTFPQREWLTGVGRGAMLLAALNGVLISLLLLEGGLILSLLIHRGQFDAAFTEAEATRFQQFTGHVIPGLRSAAPAAPDSAEEPPPQPPAAVIPAEDAGSDDSPAAVPQAAPLTIDPNPVVPPDLLTIHFDEAGILPSVWRSRDTWWGPPLAECYRRFGFLQQNIPALLGLILTFAATWMLRVWCLAALRGVCRQAALAVSTRLRRQLHRQSMRLATEDLDGHGLQEAIRLFGAEVDRIREGLYQWLWRGSRYPWELAFLVVSAFSVDFRLATQWVLLSILGWFVIARSQQQTERTKRQASDRADRELASLCESLRSARLIRGFGLDNFEQAQFQERLSRYLSAVTVQNRVKDDPLWLRLMVGFAGVMLASFLFFVWGAKVLSGDVSPAGATVFLAAFIAGLLAIRELLKWPDSRAEVAVVSHHVWRYLDQLPEVSQAVGAKFMQPLSKSLHIVDVTYRQPGGRVLLNRVDVQLTAKRSYAVVGLSPQEVRAFVSLFPRFIEPQSGRVLFDGEDIAWGTLESLRAETLFVAADDPFLPGTVLDNIRAGMTEVTLTQATEAAKEARIHNYISRLPQGYETVLEEQASLFGPGQRLQLSLARALLRDPAVLVIEEPADGLDDATKQLLDDTYDRICPGRTIFFVPHRLSTVRRCDDILMLHRGRLEAMGPHALLVKESPLYQHWEYLNFHEFRHADA